MRLLCLERDAVVRCVRGGSATSCWGQALCLAQPCFQRQFFWFSDTDHIEPFVSKQTDVYTQFTVQHFLLLLERSLKAEGCRF